MIGALLGNGTESAQSRLNFRLDPSSLASLLRAELSGFLRFTRSSSVPRRGPNTNVVVLVVVVLVVLVVEPLLLINKHMADS